MKSLDLNCTPGSTLTRAGQAYLCVEGGTWQPTHSPAGWVVALVIALWCGLMWASLRKGGRR